MVGREAGAGERAGGDNTGEVMFWSPRIDVGEAMDCGAWGDTGILSKISARPCPGCTLAPSGLGLRLLKLPIGLAKPLLRPTIESNTEFAGETTATSLATSSVSILARIAAALSNTEGTDCSSCSVPLARGIR